MAQQTEEFCKRPFSSIFPKSEFSFVFSSNLHGVSLGEGDPQGRFSTSRGGQARGQSRYLLVFDETKEEVRWVDMGTGMARREANALHGFGDAESMYRSVLIMPCDGHGCK